MDEFGVLTERFGLKPQGKSAPMAASRRPVNTNDGQSWNVGFDSDVNPNLSSFSDDRNGFYQSGKDTKTQNSGRLNDYDDIFGGPSKQSASHGGSSSFDIGSILSGSNVNSSSSHAYDDDDIFGVRGLNSSTSANNAMNSDDIFGSFASPPNPSAPIDDLLADFVGADAKPKFSNRNTSGNAVNQASGFDDLIPGFGPSVPSNNGRNTNSQHPRHSTTSTFTSSEDPFAVLESTTTSTSKNAYASANLLDPLERISKPNNPGGIKPPRLKSPPKGTHISRGHKVKSSNMSSVKSSSVSSLDELEDFAMFKVQSNVNGRPIPHSSGEWLGTSANKASSHGGDDFSIFENGRSSSVPRSRTTTLDPMFDSQSKSRGVPEPGVPQRTTSRTSSVMKKSTSASGIFDDLSSMFGDVQILEEFQEVEGESEERRNARIERLQRTHDRMTKALADMNQRDFQSQQEQEERRRIAETLDAKIKRWAAGKEGNMRALLSSLQYVLWPECGWEPVSLTDIITSSSVKKVYRKATLYVHPDKVQQKGATLEQKYTAEKIFDLLKEAWNKFNKEELSKC